MTNARSQERADRASPPRRPSSERPRRARDSSAAAAQGSGRTIVVGVDGSPGAGRALLWAAARSREAGAVVLAVHVLTYDDELAGDLLIAGLTWRRTRARQLAGPWTEGARAADAAVRTRLVEDESPCAGLLAVADAEQADLIVLGTHGHGNLADRLLGATTYKVAHRAQTPVVIVPVHWHPPPAL